jgi:hypothetical protein
MPRVSIAAPQTHACHAPASPEGTRRGGARSRLQADTTPCRGALIYSQACGLVLLDHQTHIGPCGRDGREIAQANGLGDVRGSHRHSRAWARAAPAAQAAAPAWAGPAPPACCAPRPPPPAPAIRRHAGRPRLATAAPRPAPTARVARGTGQARAAGTKAARFHAPSSCAGSVIASRQSWPPWLAAPCARAGRCLPRSRAAPRA